MAASGAAAPRNRHPDSQAGPDGSPSRAELEAEVQALRAEVERSRLILASAIDYAIITMDKDGRITSWNDGAQTVLGYSEAEVLGRSGEIIFTSEDRAADRFTGELRRATETGRASNERWHLRRDGSRFWASGVMMPLLDPGGQPRGFLNIMRDRTERQAEAERRELLMAEMSHRVRNTFALVHAIASQTSRHAATPADFGAAFGARLTALARSHDVLIRGSWQDAALRDVIEGALAAYGGEPGRIKLAGPPVMLAANLVVTVSLAFYELAANAAKYGALSAPGGQVDVAWTLIPAGNNRQAEITWREQGGPPVQPPTRRGFGSYLLQKGIAGTARLDFQPAGLQCRMTLPLGTNA